MKGLKALIRPWYALIYKSDARSWLGFGEGDKFLKLEISRLHLTDLIFGRRSNI